ncbi:MAG TPA: DM13 domain-containing protein, partial [Rhizobacter sp.]
GEGRVQLSARSISFDGKLAPGPDYKLYLAPQFVETEAEFQRLKPSMLRVGDVRNFERFVLALPPGTELTRYNTVVIWCETFSQFITAATYR